MSATSDLSQLIDIDISRVDIDRRSGGQMTIKIIKPLNYGPHPVVMLLMGMMGVNPALCSLGRLIAEEGYAVVIPDLYHGVSTLPNSIPRSFDEGLDAMHSLREQDAMGDLEDTIRFISHRRDMDKTRVSLLGHCMGGRLSLLAGNYFSRQLRCISSFYASGLESSGCSFRDIAVPVQMVNAGKSLFAEPRALARIEQNIRENNNFVETISYPHAAHNFLDARDRNYNPVYAAEALYRSINFVSDNSCMV